MPTSQPTHIGSFLASFSHYCFIKDSKHALNISIRQCTVAQKKQKKWGGSLILSSSSSSCTVALLSFVSHLCSSLFRLVPLLFSFSFRTFALLFFVSHLCSSLFRLAPLLFSFSSRTFALLFFVSHLCSSLFRLVPLFATQCLALITRSGWCYSKVGFICTHPPWYGEEAALWAKLSTEEKGSGQLLQH